MFGSLLMCCVTARGPAFRSPAKALQVGQATPPPPPPPQKKKKKKHKQRVSGLGSKLTGPYGPEQAPAAGHGQGRCQGGGCAEGPAVEPQRPIGLWVEGFGCLGVPSP